MKRIDWRRWRCQIFGCLIGEDSLCVRCETFIYDGIHPYPCAWWQWLLNLRFRWKRRFCRSTCEVCRKKFWLRKHEEWYWPTCSEECLKQWVPF